MKNHLFILIPLLYLMANAYVGLRLYQLLPGLLLKWLAVLLLVFGFASLILPMLLREHMPLPLSQLLYNFGSSWIIIFLYLLMFWVLIDLFRLFNHFTHTFDKDLIYKLFHHNGPVALAITGLFALIFVVANWNYRQKDRVHIQLQSHSLERPLRVVALSDLHLGMTIGRAELSKWVELINAEKPDLIVIAGDLLDNSAAVAFHYQLDAELRNLKAPLGVYASPGNHEYISGIKGSKEFFERSNITLLQDSLHELEGITLIGRDDYSNRNRLPLSKLMQMRNERAFTLLLDHQPQHLDEAVQEQVDFQVSGHTHRGQVFPISLITDRLFELSHGYLQKKKTHFYVSSGMGVWGGKFRIGTRSDYLVLDLEGVQMETHLTNQ